MSTACAVCRADTTGLHLCNVHIKYLEEGLGEVPWLISELQTTILKQDRLHKTLGKTEQDTRSVINFGASRLASDVQILLAGWVTKLITENKCKFLPAMSVPHDFVGPLLPAWRHLPKGYSPTSARLSRWLAHHVNVAAGREDAGDLYNAIIELTGDPDKASHQGRLVRAINRKDRVFAGPCPTEVGYDDEGAPVECAVPLWADGGQEEAFCPRCKTEVNVAENQARAKKSRDLLTEVELLKTLDILDEHVPRVTLYDWIKRRRVHVHGYLHQGSVVPDKIRNSDPRVFSLDQVRDLRRQESQEGIAS